MPGKSSTRIARCIVVLSLLASSGPLRAEWRAGAAKVNITPSYNVRLSGYGSRTTENEGVKVDIWAKALAFAWDDEPPAIIITVDNCGVPGTLREQVLAALKSKGVIDERFAVCSSHTHCAPVLNGMLGNIFGIKLPDAEQANVDRYTDDLRQWMIQAAASAIKAMRPARLEVGTGSVGFAGNRRYKSATGFANSPNPEGPVDHDLPVLKVVDKESGHITAVFASYACHCTTLNWNFIHPDWAGIAQLHLESAYPKAVALTAIGCGADQNPYPRREENIVRIHGFNLAKEARRVIAEPMRSIAGPVRGGLRRVDLPFAAPPTRDELQQRLKAAKTLHERFFATHFLGVLDSGGTIPAALPYTVQTFVFGGDLVMVFLNGEVVVDYGLRLKREFDHQRLWVNAYSNDVPCYIPSERVLAEGGYEGGGAMLYYLRPNKFAPGVEDKIIHAVHEIVPAAFRAAAAK